MEKSQEKIAWISLLLITFFVPLAVYRGTYNFLLIKLSLTQILILFSLVLWLGRSLHSGKVGVGFTCARKGIRPVSLKLRRTPLDWPLAFFFFFSLLSLLASNYRWAGPPAIFRLITYLLLYWLTVNVVRDRQNLNKLVFVWLLSTVIVSFYGLYQHFFTGITPPRSTFGNANFFAAYLVLVFPLALALFINSIFSYRNFKVTPHLNPLPQGERRLAYMFPLFRREREYEHKSPLLLKEKECEHKSPLPLKEKECEHKSPLPLKEKECEHKSPLPTVGEGRVRGELRKNWLRILSLATLLLAMILSLFLASARGAWLGLVISLIFLGWLACLQKRRWIAKRLIPAFLILSLILTASLSPWLLKQEFIREDLEQGTAGIRMLIWEGTTRMIAAHPFVGSGIGSFQVAYPKHRLPEYFRNPHAVDATAHAHNEFLQVAAETGILGLAAFLWVLIIFFKKGIELVKKEEDRNKRVLILGLIAGVAGLLATNLVGVNLRFPTSAIFLWLTMGLVMSQSPSPSPSPIKGEGTMTKLSLPLRQIILGLVLLLAGWIGWQVVAKPFLAEKYFRKGANYAQVRNWERTIYYYRKATAIDPYFIRVYYRLGFAYAISGDIDNALSAYKRVIDLAPDFARIQANIAFIYKKRGELDKAIRAYQRALELNPYDTIAIRFLKEIYEKKSPVNF